MAYGTLDYINAEGFTRSFCSRRRLLAHRTDHYALFADGDRSLRTEDNDFGFDNAKLGDRAKHDRCLCRNRNIDRRSGRFSLIYLQTRLGRSIPATVTTTVTIGQTPFKTVTATLIRTYHAYTLDAVTGAFLICLSPMWSIRMDNGNIARSAKCIEANEQTATERFYVD